LNFLIDECLHTSLVEVAQARGHDATHINFRGLSGTQDWNLIPTVIEESFTFITNNAGDFLRLFGQEEAHAGLVVVLPNVEPTFQRELFEVVLDEIAHSGDLFNQAIKVWFTNKDRTEIETERLDLAVPEGS
jgi:predicted nuclease of predicted toxin-antitoxin system